MVLVALVFCLLMVDLFIDFCTRIKILRFFLSQLIKIVLHFRFLLFFFQKLILTYFYPFLHFQDIVSYFLFTFALFFVLGSILQGQFLYLLIYLLHFFLSLSQVSMCICHFFFASLNSIFETTSLWLIDERLQIELPHHELSYTKFAARRSFRLIIGPLDDKLPWKPPQSSGAFEATFVSAKFTIFFFKFTVFSFFLFAAYPAEKSFFHIFDIRINIFEEAFGVNFLKLLLLDLVYTLSDLKNGLTIWFRVEIMHFSADVHMPHFFIQLPFNPYMFQADLEDVVVGRVCAYTIEIITFWPISRCILSRSFLFPTCGAFTFVFGCRFIRGHKRIASNGFTSSSVVIWY